MEEETEEVRLGENLGVMVGQKKVVKDLVGIAIEAMNCCKRVRGRGRGRGRARGKGRGKGRGRGRERRRGGSQREGGRQREGGSQREEAILESEGGRARGTSENDTVKTSQGCLDEG